MLLLAFVAGFAGSDGQEENKDANNDNNCHNDDGCGTHEHGDADVLHNGCVKGLGRLRHLRRSEATINGRFVIGRQKTHHFVGFEKPEQKI